MYFYACCDSLLVVKNDVMRSNVNITKLYGKADIIKHQSGSQMMLNDIMLVCPLIYILIYH